MAFTKASHTFPESSDISAQLAYIRAHRNTLASRRFNAAHPDYEKQRRARKRRLDAAKRAPKRTHNRARRTDASRSEQHYWTARATRAGWGPHQGLDYRDWLHRTLRNLANRLHKDDPLRTDYGFHLNAMGVLNSLALHGIHTPGDRARLIKALKELSHFQASLESQNDR